MSDETTALEDLTVKELKARAKDSGISYSDLEPIEAGGKTPAKADWVHTIQLAGARAGEADELPSQQDLIRVGLLEGLTNPEIRDRMLEVYPDSAMKPEHVSWTIGNERRNETDWWETHKERLKEVRPGIKT